MSKYKEKIEKKIISPSKWRLPVSSTITRGLKA